MIIVTGASGFIGSNLIHALNERGHDDIVAVDGPEPGRDAENLGGARLLDFVPQQTLFEFLDQTGEVPRIVFHQGACSNTMATDGRFMLENNYQYSRNLLNHCTARDIPFIYASSASVYGHGPIFKEELEHENPCNLYAYSKYLFDLHVRQNAEKLTNQVVGLRYFNVYGPREAHKGDMASVAYKLQQQLKRSDKVRLFEGSDGYENGEQLRDFVWVGDVVAVNLWFMEHGDISGIFNVGTGRAQTFNDVANAVIGHHGRGEIEYIPFPDQLRGQYQSYTEADIDALRSAGYDAPFRSVEEGVSLYLKWLEEQHDPS